jgi:hypothetical protein
VNEVGCDQLGHERGQHIGEKNDGLGNSWTDEIEGGREDNDIEDIVDEAWVVRIDIVKILRGRTE